LTPEQPSKEVVEAQEVLKDTGEVEPQGIPEKEPKTEPKEILKSAGEVTLELTPLQKAGLWLALGVGLAIAVVTLFVLCDWFSNRPAVPQLTGDATQAKATLDNFQALNAAALSRATELFDLIVVKAFLPVFTAILGYIFGSSGSKQG
jgi:hypothetical protein